MPRRTGRPTWSPSLRRAVIRHVALSLALGAIICGLVACGVVLSTRNDARRDAEQVARQVAAAVAVPLSEHDFSKPVDPVRADVTHDLAPFLASGMVRRVKVWTPTPAGARIAYSDKTQVEGEEIPGPAMFDGYAPGRVRVTPVPRTHEHRFELEMQQHLLEVFFGLRDSGGNPTQLELYIPTDAAGAAERTASALLPLLLGGLAALMLTTLPLSARLARRLERERAEQRAARRYGLASAESTRLELARHLHNTVIPDLAGARMLLELVRDREDGAGSSRDLLDQAHDLVDAEVKGLRTILNGMVTGYDTRMPALDDLAARLRREVGDDAPPVEVTASTEAAPSREVVLLLQWIGEELLRNALRHARAERVGVDLTCTTADGARLTVWDTGIGLGGARPAVRTPRGGVGMQLARRLIEDHGGRMAVSETPGGGTTVTVTLPPDVSTGGSRPDERPEPARGGALSRFIPSRR